MQAAHLIEVADGGRAPQLRKHLVLPRRPPVACKRALCHVRRPWLLVDLLPTNPPTYPPTSPSSLRQPRACKRLMAPCTNARAAQHHPASPSATPSHTPRAHAMYAATSEARPTRGAGVGGEQCTRAGTGGAVEIQGRLVEHLNAFASSQDQVVPSKLALAHPLAVCPLDQPAQHGQQQQ